MFFGHIIFGEYIQPIFAPKFSNEAPQNRRKLEISKTINDFSWIYMNLFSRKGVKLKFFCIFIMFYWLKIIPDFPPEFWWNTLKIKQKGFGQNQTKKQVYIQNHDGKP